MKRTLSNFLALSLILCSLSAAVSAAETVPVTTEQTVSGEAALTAQSGAGEIPVDEAHFPDPYFRDWVSKNADQDANGFLSQKERDQVTYTNVSGGYYENGPVASMQGLKYFSNLTALHCDHNQLKSLDVSGCTGLNELFCHSNQLTDLDVSHQPALEKLLCGDNQLKSLDVSKNPKLTWFTCHGNQLTNLNVSNQSDLDVLDCRSNPLKTLDVSRCTALTELSCGETQLKSLDVSKCPGLESLYCHKNQLTDLDLSQNTALEILMCSENQLKSLDVSMCTGLTYLHCHKNQLTSLDLSRNQNIEELYAAENFRSIQAPDGTVKLGTLQGFDPARASNWSNSTVNNGILTVKDPAMPVTYTYDLGNGKTQVFSITLTWKNTKTLPIYRLYNPYTGEHLLSNNENEKNTLVKGGWKLDGVAWNSVTEGTVVYRLYNPYDQSHLYSMNQKEIQNCLRLGWKMDGPVSHSAAKENGIPIYRLFNPYAASHYHLFSTNQAEINMLTKAGWKLEGVAWYAAK